LVILTNALDDAQSGQGRIVMLAGGSGIGKTRIAHELVTQADAKGTKTLWGWCYERR
jgi:predicted ATPase